MECDLGTHRQNIYFPGKAVHPGKNETYEESKKKGHKDNTPNGNREKQDI